MDDELARELEDWQETDDEDRRDFPYEAVEDVFELSMEFRRPARHPRVPVPPIQKI